MVLERSTFNPNTLGLAQALLSTELPTEVGRLYDWLVLMHGIVIKFLKFTRDCEEVYTLRLTDDILTGIDFSKLIEAK